MLNEVKKLRIVLLSPYALDRPGGVQGQVVGLARHLNQRGHHVMVLSPGEKEESVKDGVVYCGLGRVREVAGNGARGS